jgi:hypothetical protein
MWSFFVCSDCQLQIGVRDYGWTVGQDSHFLSRELVLRCGDGHPYYSRVSPIRRFKIQKRRISQGPSCCRDEDKFQTILESRHHPWGTLTSSIALSASALTASSWHTQCHRFALPTGMSNHGPVTSWIACIKSLLVTQVLITDGNLTFARIFERSIGRGLSVMPMDKPATCL